VGGSLLEPRIKIAPLDAHDASSEDNKRSTSSIPIPFTGWSPHPNRILHDVAAGRLTLAQGWVEQSLYTLADSETWTVKVRDLDALAGLIGWDKSVDYLSRVLAALRAKARVSFETRPGSTRHPYEIRLLYDSPPLSCPSTVRAATRQRVRAGGAP